MPTLSLCLECGAEISAATLRGRCSKCLFHLGLGSSVESGSVNADEESIDLLLGNGTDADAKPGPILPAVRRLGNYELLEEIARGGMGVVYRARQVSLDRVVAVKVIVSGQFASREQALRFQMEAEAAARLQHPHIVRIHETGEHEGQPYFSMDYVGGGNLAGLVRLGPISVRRAATLVQTLAQAIHYAHEQGVLHRDLKPSNVLLDDAGQPRITDFGLARRVEKDSFLTVTGQVLGSPNFMPPEQAGAKLKAGRPSDVYALGGVLFYLLTGRPPFVAGTVPETLQQVLTTDPVSPKLLNASVPADLVTICLKCLEKEPARRYQTALELDNELGRFLRDEPIHARSVGATARSWRWCLRKPALASALGGVLFLLLVVSVGAPFAFFRIRHENLVAEQRLYAADIRAASQRVRDGSIPPALESLHAIAASPRQRGLRGWEWRHLMSLCRSQDIGVLRGHASTVAAVAFAPDHSLLASISEDGVVKLWNWVERREVSSWVAHPPGPDHTFSPWTSFHSLAFSSDGARLATGGADGLVRVWNVGTRSVEFTLSGDGRQVTAVAFSSDGRRLAFGTMKSRLHLWAISGPEPDFLAAWSSETSWVHALQFLPEGTELMVAGNRSMAAWDISEPSEPRRVEGRTGGSEAIALSPDGRSVVSFGAVGSALSVWSLPGFLFERELPQLDSVIGSPKFSADGRLLAGGGGDGAITLLDFQTGRSLAVLHGHEDAVTQLAFSPRGRVLASASKDKTVRLWDAEAAAHPQPQLRHGTKVQAIRFLADSARFITVGQGSVRLPDTEEGESHTLIKLWEIHVPTNGLPTAIVLATATNLGQSIHNVAAVSPDERILAVNEAYPPNAAANLSRLLELPTLAPITNLVGEHPAFGSADERMVYARGSKLLLRRSFRAEPVVVGSASSPVAKLALSPDGRTAVTRHERDDAALQFWNLEQPGDHVTIQEHEAGAQQLTFSPDGRWLASAAWDQTVGLWDVATRRLVKRFRGHREGVNGVTFSTDSRTLASGSGDGTVRLWDLRTLRELAVLPAQSAGVWSLAFSPDSQWLVVGGMDGTVLLWRAPPMEVIENRSL